ncbi:MAG: hypothetical protein EA375_02380 [Acholeplasmataceae bacterium]|nr:MAG: hypothetical protein EA375_02380 [Acholeplasmataceae bacterium]
MKWFRLAVIGVLLVGLTLYVLLFNMRPSARLTSDLIPFSRDGFVDAETLTDTNRLMAENDRFELYLDETTSYFRVVDKRNGAVWASNPTTPDPWEADPDKPITVSALNNQKSTLALTYFNRAGSLSTINNYTLSIYHPESILAPAGIRTFMIKDIDMGFQVLYKIQDLEIDYLFFPKYLPKDVLEAMEDRALLEQIAYTGYDEELDAYEIVQYENMSRLVKRRLYQIFYEKMDYTRERAIEENFSFGYTDMFEKVSFEVAIQVRLHEHGLETSIIQESIVEPEEVKIASITLLPLFGTAVSEIAGDPTEGYIVLPDGAGALIEFNNGKYYLNPYRKRLYGMDLALMRYRMREQQQDITIPLYGMVKPGAAYAAIITEGDAMATIHADVSGRIDSYNKAYVTFNLRESESIILGSGFNRYGLDLWTRTRVATDFTVHYHLLDGDDADYVGIARAFRQHLIDQHGFEAHDTTGSTVLTTEFIGAYDRKAFFLGVPYSTTRSLTSFDEARTIIDMLLEEDITRLNVLYTGVFNGGLSSSVQDRADIERVLGGSRGFARLADHLEAHDVNLYPRVSFLTASNYHRMFDRMRYTSLRVKGAYAMHFTYHYPSGLPYSETPYPHQGDDYVINPLYYEAIFDRFSRDFDHPDIAMTMMGSMLGGHYDRQHPLYKQDALRYQQAVLESSSYRMMIANPLSFAIPYADVIIDLPTETTLYAIIDDQIPLLHLVLAGMVDYFSESINMSHDRSIQYKFLKLLETGSNLKYTLSYHDSRVLLETDYNYYMSTHYVNWFDQMVAHVREMDEIGLHEGHLIHHERVRMNVYRVTYSHGLVLVINYNLTDVDVDGRTIRAMDYLVWEV